MQKFSFRLQSVLNLKEHKLKEAEKLVYEQEQALHKAQKVLKDLQDEKHRILLRRMDFTRQMNFVMMDLSRNFEIGIDFKITTQELKLQDIYKELKRRRGLYQTARKEHKTYLKLLETAQGEYDKERLQHEQKFLDDLNVIRANPSRKEKMEQP
ncbi:MAG: flagellar FliJ family protein [Candidatus Cloacimonetes bacterium]|nr:flagellar FliJ family protein [Candidatus Cloacimonadota bacterium]